MIRRALLLSLVFGSLSLGATPPSPAPKTTLAQTLSAEEFARAGLNKLTPDELAFLDAALARRASPTAATAPAKAEKARPSREKVAADFGAEQVAQKQPVADAGELHTHIEGTVQEFSGRAVFALGNGQIWQMRTPADIYLTKKLVNPEVTLLRGAGGYKMVIDAANVVVLVKRIQ
ncbi:MAG: hypothetical protein NTV51_11360 [Verrucomicrobia bacterium]|nr:hypothetical protein [Verrucomicrobiota bacterium]